MHDLIDRYLACWNETDSTARRDLIARTWADDASYIDPLVDAQGHDAIDAAIAATQGQFPGHVFALAGRVDAHHDVATAKQLFDDVTADEASGSADQNLLHLY